MTPVIELNGLGKRYWKLEEHAKLTRAMMPFVRPRREELWALRNFDLKVAAGETLGVLGHNGAGKTTLLRLLAGVTSPTEGRVRVTGRVAPLIGLGVGFHQEMSGRENVFVNGMLLGLTADEISKRFDSIVAFAEIGEFIDTPVKFYSSGMFMRLGFAVVIHVDPTILLVDEILAVGDASFQLKCFERLRHLRDHGAAVVVVTHSLHTIRQLCRRAILIRGGRLEYDGQVDQAIAMHFHTVSHRGSQGRQDSGVEILERRLLGGEHDGHHANHDDPLEMALRLLFKHDANEVVLTFTIETDGGFPVTSETIPLQPDRFIAGQHLALRVRFRARLGAGNYRLAATLRDGAGILLGETDDLMLFVAGPPSDNGVVQLKAEFLVDGVDRTDRRAMLLGP